MTVSVINEENRTSLSSAPLVSVCIPTYNGAAHIKETIKSVLAQTYANLEIVVSDDGSTDETLDIVREFDDERIQIVNNHNHGMVGNFSNCLNSAKGKYIKILCQDDLLTNNSIELETEAFEKNESVTVVTGSSNIINENGKTVMKRHLYNSDKLIDGKKFAKKTFMAARNFYGETSVTMFRTEQAMLASIFDHSKIFCVDWDGCLRLSYLGDVFYIASPVAEFRISNESTSVKMHKSSDNKAYKMSIELFEKHKRTGEIKLTSFQCFKFKILTKFNIFARHIIHKVKLKKREV